MERGSETLGAARREELRTRVDAVLRNFLAGHRRALAEADPDAATLIDELDRVIGAGGKRLRPLFCYWGYRAGGGSDGDGIVRAAASLELLHTFAIIHDDVMDRSSLRRGQPATHVALAVGGDAHTGMSAAILAGDLAVVLSDELFRDAGFPPEAFMAGSSWYNRMRAEVVAGQYLDLIAARGAPDEATVRRVARLKSGGYTVEKPVLIGAALAGASPDAEAMLSSYGIALGEAFQIRDDVLGAFGDPVTTGKDADGDLREGKRTLLVVRALAAAAPSDRAFMEGHLGRADLSPDGAERIREIIRASGALEQTSQTIDELRTRALASLDGAAIPNEALAALRELAERAVTRTS